MEDTARHQYRQDSLPHSLSLVVFTCTHAPDCIWTSHRKQSSQTVIQVHQQRSITATKYPLLPMSTWLDSRPGLAQQTSDETSTHVIKQWSLVTDTDDSVQSRKNMLPKCAAQSFFTSSAMKH